MAGRIAYLAALWSFAALSAAQQTDFEDGTGTRSLWIPYKTLSGVPQASILGVNTLDHRTTYVISCPTDQADCAIAPNITLTEGTDLAKWTSITTGADVAGTVAINCPSLTTDFPITCHQNAVGGGQVRSTSQVLQSDEVIYQAVAVTATMNNTATMGQTVTVTELPTTQPPPETVTVTAGAGAAATLPAKAKAWGMVGAVGGGLAALVAL